MLRRSESVAGCWGNVTISRAGQRNVAWVFANSVQQTMMLTCQWGGFQVCFRSGAGGVMNNVSQVKGQKGTAQKKKNSRLGR